MQQHSNRAQRLSQILRELRSEFPGFACRIDQFIAIVESDAKRSRSYDREKVLAILRSWSCGISIKELMEDTGYSHWDVRQILAELMKKGLVTKVPGRSARHPDLYRLC